MFHGIAAGVQLIGLVVVAFGALRLLRATTQAAQRAAAAADRPPFERERYARGLTDFYRISGAVAIVAGVILLLVPIFAR